jgi:hypothetical protein
LIFEFVHPGAKLAGMVSGRHSVAANLGLKILIGNRVGASLFFPLIAYLIESGFTTQKVVSVLFFGLVAAAIVLMLSAVHLEKMVYVFARFLTPASDTVGNQCPKFRFDSVVIFGAIAGLLAHVGMLGPLLASTVFPEYRLTMTHAGGIFNGIFTLIVVFVVDNKLSRYCDAGDSYAFVYLRNFFIGRLIATMIFIGVLWFLSHVSATTV